MLFWDNIPLDFSSYVPLKVSVNVLFLANYSCSLDLIKLKLNLELDHDMEQHILFWGYSPWNISSNAPLKILMLQSTKY